MYSARKTWCCSLLDLVILFYRPITKCVNRSPPLPSCEFGILCPIGKKIKDRSQCSPFSSGKLLLQVEPEESSRELAPFSTKSTWRGIPNTY